MIPTLREFQEIADLHRAKYGNAPTGKGDEVTA